MKRQLPSRELRMPTVVFVVTLLLCACSLLTAQTQSGSLAYLSKHIGGNSTTVLKTQPLQRRIVALIGVTEYKSLISNTDVANALTQENNVLYFAGNAPHRGREEEGAVMIDPAKDSVQLFLLHNGNIVRGWPRTIAWSPSLRKSSSCLTTGRTPSWFRQWGPCVRKPSQPPTDH